MEVEVRDGKEELACAKGDCKEKYSKLEGAIDEELELSPPSPPKRMLSQKRTRRVLKNHQNMSSGKTCGNIGRMSRHIRDLNVECARNSSLIRLPMVKQ